MLPHQHRLVLRKFPTFFAQARQISTPCLSGFYQAAPTLSVAVIVPKKNIALSNKRHQIKRLIHQSIKNLIVEDQNLGQTPAALVLLVKRGCQNHTTNTWQAELKTILIKVKTENKHVDRTTSD